MCGICGCSDMSKDSKHEHHHQDDSHLVQVQQDILASNQHLASHNQQMFLEKNILALNIMSSPGSGKTTLLAKTINDLKHELDISVIVGDQQTDADALILKASGAPAIQINTGRGCHLDAHMVSHALDDLDIKNNGLLFIENVGNLVCPALFALGETYRVVLLSVTEGDNKPLKYPDMFHSADLVVITKTDLLPYVAFDLQQCIESIRRIKPTIEILCLSATKEDGLTPWYEWIKNGIKKIAHRREGASTGGGV